VIATLALSPLEDDDLDVAIERLGGKPGKGYGLVELLDQVAERQGTRVFTPRSVLSLKQKLIEGGWVHPDTPIDANWKPGDPFWQGFRNMEDHIRKEQFRGNKTGSMSSRNALEYLGNFMYSEVWRGLSGFAKNLVTGLGETAERVAIGVQRTPTHVGALTRSKEEWRREVAKTKAIEIERTGETSQDTATQVNDLINILSFLPLARGAKVVSGGARAALTAERGLLTAGAGVRGGTAPTLVSRLATKAVNPAKEATAAKIAQFGPGGYRRIAEHILHASDVLARAKSTPLGMIGTAITNAGVQTSISARALGALGAGEILPNVDISDIQKTRLSQMIDEAPALGSSLRYEILGKENPLGNPVDLAHFIWNPTQSLPLRVRDIRNGVTNLVGYDQVRPLTRYLRAATGERVTRAGLIDEIGGAEHLSRAMRYFRAQAAAFAEASERLRAKGIPAEKWEEAMPEMVQTVKAEFKKDPQRMESVMSQVNDTEMGETIRFLFKDYPEKLEVRGQGKVDLRNWYDTMMGLGEITLDKVRVRPFVRGTKVWAQAPGNAQALDEAYDELARLMPTPEKVRAGIAEAGEGFPGLKGKLKYEARMKRKFAEAVKEGELAYARTDNPLATAQDRAATTRVLEQLVRVADDLKLGLTRTASTGLATDVAVKMPTKVKVRDLVAAGLDPATIQFSADPKVRRVLTLEEAQRLNGSVSQRLDEIRDTIKTFLPETAGIEDDAQLIRKMRRLTQVAGRAVNLKDEAFQARMIADGKQPILLNKDALTLRDVDPGHITATLGEASRLAPVAEWLGLTNRRLANREIGQLRTLATVNELDLVAKEQKLAASGRDLLEQLGELRQNLPEHRSRVLSVGGRKIWNSGQLFDLRQIKVADLTRDLGWTPEQAQSVYAAIRRGAAFGADFHHPLKTVRDLGEALRINGLSAFEDWARTSVSNRPQAWKGGLNLPENLIRARDFIQFQLSPYFTLGNMVEAKLLRGATDLPLELRPSQARKTAEKLRAQFGDEFDAVQEQVMGGRGKVYATTLDETRQGAHGFFGFNLLDAEAVDTWRLYRRQLDEVNDGVRGAIDYDEIRTKVDEIYRYGPRSAAEKSANYIFFPLSFNLKMTRSLLDWYTAAPARILMTQAGLAAFDHVSEDLGWREKVERYLPIVKELNRLNTFARGFGITTGYLGGRNKLIERGAQALATALAENPMLGAFIPVGFTSEDYQKGQGVLKSLVPLFRQVDSALTSMADQKRVLDQGGSEDWQVDNYYLEMRELTRFVELKMAELGLKPNLQSLQSSQVNPEFRYAVEQERSRIRNKYPSGAIFAKRYADDLSDKAQELQDLAQSQVVLSPAEAMTLAFAAEYAKVEIDAHQRARRTRTRHRLPSGATSTRLGDDSFSEEEVDYLRTLAIRFAKKDKGFIAKYKRYFAYDLGPIDVPIRRSA
jgi:hypothetical protein